MRDNPLPGSLLQAIHQLAEDDGLSPEARLKLEREIRLIQRADRATRQPRVFRTGSYLASVGLARFLNLEAQFLSEKSGEFITGTQAEGILVEGLKSSVDGMYAWKDQFETHKGADIVVLRRERLTDGLKKFLQRALGPAWPGKIHVDRGVMAIDGDPPVALSPNRSRLLQRACDRISVKTCTQFSDPSCDRRLDYRVAYYESPGLAGDRGREKAPARETLGALRHFADHMSHSDRTVAIWHSPHGNSEDPLVRSRLVEIPHQQITENVQGILHDLEEAGDLASFDLAYLDSVARTYGCRFRKRRDTLRLVFPGPGNSEDSGFEVRFQRRQIRISCHEQSATCHSEWEIPAPSPRRRDVLDWIRNNASVASPQQSTGG